MGDSSFYENVHCLRRRGVDMALQSRRNHENERFPLKGDSAMDINSVDDYFWGELDLRARGRESCRQRGASVER